ncbi:Hypp1888 [Branchiostoma lanceolatum]|uniref:Hypp1888 protein n=1 Tax=Branchiostoma lanceolatum TaxID=7740 RepID=A0A8J9ZQG2_BRALA|nr:Hypp1888 [Branchiostoma lanceolatum]
MAEASTQTTVSLDEGRNHAIGERLMGTLDDFRQMVERYKKIADDLSEQGRETGQACAESPQGHLPPGSVWDQIVAAMSRAWDFVRQNPIIMDGAIKAIVKLLEEAGRYMDVQIVRLFMGEIAKMIPKKKNYEEELRSITDCLKLCEEKMSQIEAYVSQVTALCDRILECNGYSPSRGFGRGVVVAGRQFDTATRRADLEMTDCQARLKKAEKEINNLVEKVKVRKRDEGAGLAWIGSGTILLAVGGSGLLYWNKALTQGRTSALFSVALVGVLMVVLASAEQEGYKKLLKELQGLQKKKEDLESSLQELSRKLESEARAVETLSRERDTLSPDELDD